MIPAIPDDIHGARTEGPVTLRYEDVSQEGRLLVLGVPHVVDQLCWLDVMRDPASRRLLDSGVIPIRARMVVEVGEGPVSALAPLHGRAAWHRAAVLDDDGAVKRLLLLMWVDLFAKAGWTLLPPDPDAPVIRAGRVYLEHILTRPFAPAEDRRVTAVEGWRPESGWPERRPEDVAPAPQDDTPRRVERRAFGVMHTDPNNHVNSLITIRAFEEAALSLRGAPDAARSMEVIWRRPFFSGETATLTQWAVGDEIHGLFTDDDGGVRARMTMGW